MQTKQKHEFVSTDGTESHAWKMSCSRTKWLVWAIWMVAGWSGLAVMGCQTEPGPDATDVVRPDVSSNSAPAPASEQFATDGPDPAAGALDARAVLDHAPWQPVVLLSGRQIDKSHTSFLAEADGTTREVEVFYRIIGETAQLVLSVYDLTANDPESEDDAASEDDALLRTKASPALESEGFPLWNRSHEDPTFTLEFQNVGGELRWIERVPGAALHMTRRQSEGRIRETYAFSGEISGAVPFEAPPLPLPVEYDRHEKDAAAEAFRAWYPDGNALDGIPEAAMVSRLLAGQFSCDPGFTLSTLNSGRLTVEDLPTPGQTSGQSQFEQAFCSISNLCRLIKCFVGGISNMVCAACTGTTLACLFFQFVTWGIPA